jgi:hypothetical protein
MIRHRVGVVVLGLAAVVLLTGCRSRTVGAAAGTAESVMSAPGSVMFRIKEQGSVRRGEAETRIWLASYEAEGKTARFQIKLTLKPPSGDIPFAMTNGTLYREPGSDSTVLLRDLARVLEAKAVPKGAAKQEKLPFQVAILGQGMSRSDGKRMVIGSSAPDVAPGPGEGTPSFAGSFSAEPKGSWITTKVFLADGEGEVYLNLDPAGGVGEFSIKDPEYGDIVMKELAKVL